MKRRLTVTAEQCFLQAKKLYNFTKLQDENGKPITLSDETALDMIGIIYTLRLTSYQRYMSTTIVDMFPGMYGGDSGIQV